MKKLAKALIVLGALACLVVGVVILSGLDDYYQGSESPSKTAKRTELADPGPAVPKVVVEFRSVTGRVIDRDGEPVAGVELLVYSGLPATLVGEKSVEATTRSDTQGGFRIEKLRPGKYEFVARKAGYQEARVSSVVALDATDPIRIVLSSGLAISGYVRDSFNKPIPGARVTAFIERVEKGASLQEKLTKLTDYSEMRSEVGIEAESNQDGWYQIVGLENRKYRLRTVAPALAPAELRYIAAGTPDANFFLEAGGVLRGVVVSESGQPIEGAVISAYPSPGKNADVFSHMLGAIMPPTVRLLSGEDGRFVLDQLGGGTPFRLMVKKAGHQMEPVNNIVVDPNTETELVVTLSAGLVIDGVVYDPDGRVLAGATVRANLQAARSRSQDLDDGAVQTDEDGRFSFDTLEDGKYRIVASHPDYASALENRVEPSEKMLEMRLTVGGAIAGMITDSQSGEPIAEATISLRDSAGVEKVALSDSSGNYLVRGISVNRKQRTVMSIEADQYARASNQPVPVQEGFVSEGYDYALDRKGQVSGVVLDPTGAPVAGCKVTVKRQMSSTAPILVPVGTVAISDAAGRFSVDAVAPGEGNILEGTHPEFLTSTTDPFPLEPGDHQGGLVLTLQQGGSIIGVVVDESGAPIEGAVVGVQGEYQFEMAPASMQKNSTTAADGRFGVSSLEPESHTLVAEAEGFLRTKVSGVHVVEGHTSQPVRITLVKSCFLTGFVTDAAGAVIENAKVTILDTAEGMRRISVPVDTNGVFRSDELGPYEVDVEAEAPGYTKARITGQPVNTDGVKLVLELMGSIRGRVLGADGNPVRAFSIAPRKYEDGRTLPKVPSKTFQSTDGNFEYPGIEPGAYQVVVGAPGYSVLSVDGITVVSGVASEVGTIELRQGGKVGGRIVDAYTGEPIFGATVTVLGGDRNLMPPLPDLQGRSAPARRSTVRSDRDGYFTLQGLTVDGISIKIEHREYLQVVEHGLPVGVNDLLFELGRGGMIEGRIVDQSGNPVPGRQVLLVGDNNRNERSVTDQQGVFTFSGLAEGGYTLRATQIFMKGSNPPANLQDAPTRRVTVEVGVITEVEIEIEP